MLATILIYTHTHTVVLMCNLKHLQNYMYIVCGQLTSYDNNNNRFTAVSPGPPG